jgi:Concanavalin A-like lectin/glucanases superfamily
MYTGPNIVTDGLVLALDAANPRSYNTSENLLTYTSLIGVSGSIYGTAGYRYDTIGSGSVTLTASLAPDGTNTATLISQSTAVTSYIYSQNTQLLTSSIYTYSIFAKQGTKSDFTFTIDENNFGGWRYQFTHTFATNALSFGYLGSTNNGFIISSGSLDAGNGWRRIWGTFQTSTGSVSGLVDMITRFGSTGGTTFVWGRQLEKKSFPTLYTPTTDIPISASTTWTDLSGNNNSGSLVNGPTFNSANNGSIVFDGSTTHILGAIPSSTFSGAHSICCWFNRKTVRQWSGLFSNNVGVISSAILTFIDSTNIIGTNQAGVNASYIGIDLGADHLNKWIYCVLAVSGATNGSAVNVYAYKDGSLLTSTGSLYWTLNISSTNYFIGRHYSNVTQIHDGSISNVQVYNRALTAQEVLQNYNGQKSRFNL